MPVTTLNLLTPRNNARDALAVEVALTTLAEDARDLKLRLLGTPHARHFQIHGDDQAVARAQAQLRHAYPQCDFETAPALPESAAVHRRRFLKLREGAHLPIRSAQSRDGRVAHDDFAQGADPMLGLLAAMDGLEPGEHCQVELTLRPMPGDWGKYWRGAAADVGERAKYTPQALLALLLLAGGGMLVMFGVVFVSAALLLRASLTPALIGALLALLGALAIRLRFHLPSPPDPQLIRQKTASSAFRTGIELCVHAHSAARADAYLHALVIACRAYNLSGANGFVAVESLRERDWPVLSSAELAALWHLPHGAAALQGIATTAAKTLQPPASFTHEAPGAIAIGEASHQGARLPVYLSRAALAGNIGLVAKTQSGKSNTMALIASQIIAQDPDTAVIVLDPHRRLAESIGGLIPESRWAKTVFLSLADRDHPFGLNLLDRSRQTGDSARATELFADKMTSDIIETLREIWTDNWGPRMENYLRWPLLTLAYANERLIADHAFSQWRARATHLLREIHVRFLESCLDTNDWRVLAQLAAQFAQLERPDRVSTGRLYDALRDPLAALAKPAAQDTTRLLALEVIYVQVLQAARAGDKPVGISRRTYGPENKPLQFTLLDVMPLQMASAFRSEVRGALRDKRFQHVHDWWRNSFEMFRALNMRLLLDMITPVLTKLDRFSASDVARRIFGQPDSTIDLAALLDEGGVLLIDLASGVVGQDTAALIGSTLMNWIASLLFARQKSGAPAKRVLLVIDEFQALPGVDYAFMLSELAKYGAQLCLGTQSLGFLEQVNPKTRTAWLDNTSTLFVFRCGAEDARTLAAELSITDLNPLTLSPSDIVGLPDYTCYVRARDGAAQRGAAQSGAGQGGQQHVFQVRTQRVAEPDPDVLAAIQARSQREHCRNADEVDQLIALAQSLRGEPDLGVSRSAGWSAAAPDAGRAAAAQGDRDKAATSDRGPAERVRRGRADTTLAPDDLTTRLDDEETTIADEERGHDG